MDRFVDIVCSCVLVVFCLGTVAASVSGEERDLPAETRAIFSAKCAGCHGADLAKPEGRFGYVLDLARVASNREIVVPSSPDESELWVLISLGEMPPDDSSTGALSQEEKEAIRSWIAAGALPNSALSAQSKQIVAGLGADSTSADKVLDKGLYDRALVPSNSLQRTFPRTAQDSRPRLSLQTAANRPFQRAAKPRQSADRLRIGRTSLCRRAAAVVITRPHYPRPDGLRRSQRSTSARASRR